jgi:hypothetical protein
MYLTAIEYDRDMRDFAMYLDDDLIGFARTYHEAELTLAALVAELTHGDYATAGEATAPAARATCHTTPALQPA